MSPIRRDPLSATADVNAHNDGREPSERRSRHFSGRSGCRTRITGQPPQSNTTLKPTALVQCRAAGGITPSRSVAYINDPT